jgi:hypothetical protein
MSFEQVVGLMLVLLVMGVGLAGSVLPGCRARPDQSAAVGHRLWFERRALARRHADLAGLMVGSLLLDYVAGLVGARRLGATWGAC